MSWQSASIRYDRSCPRKLGAQYARLAWTLYEYTAMQGLFALSEARIRRALQQFPCTCLSIRWPAGTSIVTRLATRQDCVRKIIQHRSWADRSVDHPGLRTRGRCPGWRIRRFIKVLPD